MSISTYDGLKTAIAAWTNRTDLTDTRLSEFVALAEVRIARRLRVRGVEERSVTALVSGQEYYSLPSDFLEARNVQINSNPLKSLKYLTPQQMDFRYPYDSTGAPRNYTIIGEEMQLKPIPSSTNNLEIAYFKKLDALGDSNTTNWLTVNAPDMLLYASLIEAETYLVNPEKAATYAAMLDVSIEEWNFQEQKGRYSGHPLASETDTGAP
jgi:hypothetical protein